MTVSSSLVLSSRIVSLLMSPGELIPRRDLLM
jgi:hypothetical protein